MVSFNGLYLTHVVLATAGLLRALLYMLSGKLDQARQLSGQLLAAYPNDVHVVMLQAVLLAKSGKVSQQRGSSREASREAAAERPAERQQQQLVLCLVLCLPVPFV
jgi:predicted Zn-dependent protease